MLRCHPPFSYPKGILYWAESKLRPLFRAIDKSARVSQDFEGNLPLGEVSHKCIEVSKELIRLNMATIPYFFCTNFIKYQEAISMLAINK